MVVEEVVSTHRFKSRRIKNERVWQADFSGN